MGISPKKVALGAVATAAVGYGGFRATLHVRRQCHAAPMIALAGCHVYSGLALAEALRLQGVEVRAALVRLAQRAAGGRTTMPRF